MVIVPESRAIDPVHHDVLYPRTHFVPLWRLALEN